MVVQNTAHVDYTQMKLLSVSKHWGEREARLYACDGRTHRNIVFLNVFAHSKNYLKLQGLCYYRGMEVPKGDISIEL